MYKSVLFIEKLPRRPEARIKDGFEEVVLESPFGIFRPEKLEYLFRGSVAPANFSLERPKSRVPISRR